MDVRDDVRPRDVEDLVAALELLEVVLERRVAALQHGAHRPIGDDDPVVHRIQQLLGADGAGDGRRYQAQNEACKQTTAGARNIAPCFQCATTADDRLKNQLLVLQVTNLYPK